MAVTNLQFAGLTIPPAASLNAAASARPIAAAGARALVPLTYGTDRVSALILNVLVSSSDANVLLVQCLWGHACDGVDELRLNDQALPAGSVVTSYTGAQTTPDAVLVAAFAAQAITYTDALTGYAYSVVAMPSRSFTGQLDASARIRGRKVYDPRKDSTAGGAGAHRLATPATWEWSDNPALCLADWLASSTYGPAEPVLWSSVLTAAGACDATVGSPAEKRRTIGLTLTEPVSMTDLSEALRAYAGCWLVPASAGMRLVPDADAAAVASYSHESGQIAELGALVLRDRGNSPTAVEVIYTDATQVPYRDASATATLPGAGGALPWRLSAVRLPGVQRYSQALREATERLNKLTLADLTTDVEVFDVGIAHDIADIVTISHPLGLVAKAMRISGIEMPAAGRWRLSLTEHDPLVYSSDVVTLASAPDTPRVAPAGPPDNVTGLTATLTQGAIRWAWTQSAVSDYAETRLRIGASWAAGTPLWAGRANGYTQLIDTAGTYTVWAKHLNAAGLESDTAASASATLTSTDINAPGSSQATAYLFQWGGATAPGNPSGQTTYTWGTGAATSYTGGAGWLVAADANPGTPGARLWIARKAVIAPAGTVASAVSWASGFTVYAESVNGAEGAPGIKSATPTVYQWALSIPTIAGSGTYTWAAADLGTPPGVWTTAPGTGTAGQTLWGASVQLVDAAGATATAISWTGASITPRGYAGQTGISARRAYTLTTATSLGSGTVTTTGISSLPGSSTVFGSGLTWAATPATPAVGEVLYQSDGLYSPATGEIVWETPYISALKVGNLAALAVNTGALTVNDVLTVGSGGVARSTNWTSGPAGAGWRLTDTGAELPATGIRGQLVASQINANGLSIYNPDGIRILNAGASLDFNSRFGNTTGLPANGATVGATWGSDLVGRPANLAGLTGAEGINNAAVTLTTLGTTGVSGSGQLCANADFSSGSGIPTHFANYNNGYISVTNTIVAGGAVGGNFWRIHANEAVTNTFGFFFANAESAFGSWKASTNMILSFYARVSANPSGSALAMAWNNGPQVQTWLMNPVLTATWQRYSVLVNFGTNTLDVNGFISISSSSAPSGIDLDFSNIQVEQGDAPSGWSSNAWSAVTGASRPADNATVGAPNGTYVGGTLAEALVATASTASSNASEALINAATANGLLADIASDSKLTPSEKPALLLEWNNAYNGKAALNAQATAFGITTENTTYSDAFTALAQYLNAGSAWSGPPVPPAWISTSFSLTTDIVGSTFRSTWATFYTARQDLLNKVAEVAATKATWAGIPAGSGKAADNATVGAPNGTYVGGTLAESVASGAANGVAALATVNDIASDNKLTPSEKVQMRGLWDEIVSHYSDLHYKCSLLGGYTQATAYTTAFNTLGTYLNAGTGWSATYTLSIIPAWISDAQLSTTADITGSTLRAYWADLYIKQAVVLAYIRGAYYDSQAAVSNGTTGLAQRLRSNAQNVLAGPGGLGTGDLTWDSSGNRTGGYGVGMTATGLAAYSSEFGSTPAFVIDGSTGNVTLRGTVYATAGVFSGSLNVLNGGSGTRTEITTAGVRVFSGSVAVITLGIF